MFIQLPVSSINKLGPEYMQPLQKEDYHTWYKYSELEQEIETHADEMKMCFISQT